MQRKIVISDLDGVLAQLWSGGDYRFRPKAKIRAYAILTNQGGVPLRWCFKWARKKYPTFRQVISRVRGGMRWSGARKALVALYHPKQEAHPLGKCLARIGALIPVIPVPVPEGIIFLSFAARARKPSPWGLLWLARGYRPEQVVFVGDEPSDKETAEKAGVKFRLIRSERS